MIPIDEIRGTVARGWTTGRNQHIEMDNDLADAIADEVWEMINSIPTCKLVKELKTREGVETLVQCPFGEEIMIADQLHEGPMIVLKVID